MHFFYLFIYLHDGVIRRDEVGEQVKVPGGEYEGKQHLRFARDACSMGVEKTQHTKYEARKINKQINK